MSIPQGYKQTELGIIPEDWVVVRLGDIGDFSKGSGISLKDAQTGNIPAIRYGEIYTSHNYCIQTFYSYIDTVAAQRAKRLSYGDILFACSGETKEDIGKSVAYVNDIIAYAGGDIIILSPNQSCYDSLFMGYVTNAAYVISQKSSKGQGDAVVHISKDSLAEIMLSVPQNKEEQRAIAEALSDIGGLISALDKKIAKKRLIKQGAMQQLLTGKKRLPGFSDPWEEKRLGDMGHLMNGYTFKSETYNLAGEFKIITISNVQSGYLMINACNRIIELPVDILPHQMLKKGDILISMTGNVGRTCVVNQTKCLLNQRVGKFDFNKDSISSQFLFELLNNERFENAMIDAGQGAAQANIGKNDIENYKCYVPRNKAEQKAIATILSDMDKEIIDLEAKRDKYCLLKSGMMQKLLTGQIRLKII